MITTSDSTKAIAAALLRFQGHVSGVKRDGKNPHFRSNYATLENVFDTARPALQECGVTVTQAPGAIVEGSLEVTTRLTHADSGEWMQSTMHMPLGKRDPQGAGSATTYGLRYSLMAMLGLPPTDDDGEAAMDRSPQSLSSAAAPKRQVGWNKAGTARTANSLKKEKGPDTWDAFQTELSEVQTTESLRKLTLSWAVIIERDAWPDNWKDLAREEIQKRREMIINAPLPDDDVFPGDRPNSYADNYSAG